MPDRCVNGEVMAVIWGQNCGELNPEKPDLDPKINARVRAFEGRGAKIAWLLFQVPKLAKVNYPV